MWMRSLGLLRTLRSSAAPASAGEFEPLKASSGPAPDGVDGRALIPRDQFVICAVCRAWLNIAFSAAVISVGEFAV